MAAMMSFNAEKCCHLVSAHAASSMRPIRLKLLRKELSTLHHLYQHSRHAVCQFFVPRWTRYPFRVQRKTVSQVLWLCGRTQILPTSPPPSSPRSWTSLTF